MIGYFLTLGRNGTQIFSLHTFCKGSTYWMHCDIAECFITWNTLRSVKHIFGLFKMRHQDAVFLIQDVVHIHNLQTGNSTQRAWAGLARGRSHSPCQAPRLSGSRRWATCQPGRGCWACLWWRRSAGVQPAAGPRGCCACVFAGCLSEGHLRRPLPCCGGSAGWCLASWSVERLGSAAERGWELREGRKRHGCQNPKGAPRRSAHRPPPTRRRWTRREGRLSRTGQSRVGKRRSGGAAAGRSASARGPALPCSPGHCGSFWTSRAPTPTPACPPLAPPGLLHPAPPGSARYYPDPSETSSFTARFY